MTSKAKRVVTDLFDLFMSETNTLPHDWQVSAGIALTDLSPTERARIIADYIASMTDRYAISNISGYSIWAPFINRDTKLVLMNIFQYLESEFARILANWSGRAYCQKTSMQAALYLNCRAKRRMGTSPQMRL